MIRKSIYLILGFVLSVLSVQAQGPSKIGIQTRRPAETLDVNGTVRVRNLPNASRAGKIYAGKASLSTTFEPTYIVTANENGVLGKMPMSESENSDVNDWVIFPALHLPTSPSEITAPLSSFISYNASQQEFNVRNTDWARKQLAFSPALEKAYTSTNDYVKSPSAPNDIGYIGYKTNNKDMRQYNNCVYYITYYDTDVFTDVKLSAWGELTYKVKPDAVVTSKTYMTIVAQIPQLQ